MWFTTRVEDMKHERRHIGVQCDLMTSLLSLFSLQLVVTIEYDYQPVEIVGDVKVCMRDE